MKLSADAEKLRRKLSSTYDFSDPASSLLLDELCLTVDQLRSVQRSLEKDGLVVFGSMRQPRANPLLGAQDALRRTVIALTRSLRLTLDEIDG